MKKKPKSPPLFDSWAPDPVGQILGTGYNRFTSPTGIHGLAEIKRSRNEKGRVLDLLAVVATKPGTGQFREFIRQAKTEFDCIVVMAIMNEFLALTLVRYGFGPVQRDDKTDWGLAWINTDETPRRTISTR